MSKRLVSKNVKHLSAEKTLELQLIMSDPELNKLDKEFFLYLKEILADSIGPIAPILIKSAVKKMGERFDTFPSNRAMEVVEKVSLSLIIFDDERKKFLFTKMEKKLKSMRLS